MTTAADVIRSGLRLINVPGRGARLSNDDLAAGLDRLKDIIASASVSRFFVPGVNRQFFPLVPAQSIYSYGPGADFDTRPFGGGVPIQVEDAYIREGATISSNQQVTNGTFDVGTGWTIGVSWTIANGLLTTEPITPIPVPGVTQQALTLTPGTTYVLSFRSVHRAGSVNVQVLQDATPVVDQTIASNGTFEFTFTISGGSAWTITFTSTTTSQMDFDDVSIVQLGKNELELSNGSDYRLVFVDQNAYNQRFTKGTGGRPYELFWTRNFPLGELRFDNAGIFGDILVLDVIPPVVEIEDANDTLQIYSQALKWLKYRLAYEIAPEYGKAVTPAHIAIMRSAYNDMAASNSRMNDLRVDRALQGRPTFDINRGDP